ncbi:MAG: response regulator [Candidatus Omnitrophota bacterium]
MIYIEEPLDYNDPSSIKLLFVEDDKDFNEAMRARFKKRNFEVTPAFSAEEALEILGKNFFDAVLSDIRLPKLDGMEFLAEVRKTHEMLPVILLTGYANLESAREAVKLNASDYLLKPLENIDDIINPIRKAVHSHRLYLKNQQLRNDLQAKILELEESYCKLKETQNQLIQAEKSEAIGTMASGIVHEVRNPLGIISLATTYLEEKMLSQNSDEDVNSSFSAIKRSLDKANKILSTLMDFSRNSEFNLLPMNVHDVIESSISLTQCHFRTHDVELVKEFSEDLPHAMIDQKRMEQVLVNLFLNAIQAMGPGKNKIILRTFLTQFKYPSKRIGRREEDYFGIDERGVTVEIEDTGSGVDEKNIGKIFDPFFTTKDPKQGTGLGLTVSKSIVDMHKGLISVANSKENGAKFVITLKIEEKQK